MQREKSKITIYDVARHAGVAISTVSRVLNDSPDVSQRTHALVTQAIEDLKYTPDRTARALAQQELHSIAVALPSFTAPFYNELLKGVRTCLKDRELDLLICDLGSKTIKPSLYSFLRRGAVDGIMVCGVTVDERLAEEIASQQAPVILIGEVHPSFDGFQWNDKAGARDAMLHLINQGHSRIPLIRAASESRVQSDRIAGYQEALSEAGVSYDENLVVAGTTVKHGGFSEEDGYDAMQRILERMPDVTAVFASSDVQAIGAWAAITEAGKEVPNDIALVGYDDIKTSRFLGLSSVDQRMQQIGFDATERLLKRIFEDVQHQPDIQTISPQLNIRRSSQNSVE